MRPLESFTSRIEDCRVAASKDYPHFDAILARFERRFGAENIEFEVYDFACSVGISLCKGRPEDDSYYRIAFRFQRHDDMACVAAAMEFAEKWLRDETEYKGVHMDNFLEGNEMSARMLLEESKHV